MTARASKALVSVIVLASLLLLIYVVRQRLRVSVYVPPKATSERIGPPELYPDLSQTPGATDPRVTQENVADTICIAGWTATVRPPAHVMHSLKMRMMRANDVLGQPSGYELDHFVPLELGGCADCETNLWLEPYQPEPGARQKDQVENYLHRQVCDGTMTLKAAQQQIAMDWYKVYLQISSNHR